MTDRHKRRKDIFTKNRKEGCNRKFEYRIIINDERIVNCKNRKVKITFRRHRNINIRFEAVTEFYDLLGIRLFIRSYFITSFYYTHHLHIKRYFRKVNEILIEKE